LGIPEKNRYRTGDLCPLLGIHADTLRWRFKTGKYPEVVRDGKGRIFALADIERILAITKTPQSPETRTRRRSVDQSISPEKIASVPTNRTD
jgi:DNA-binding transcriptional MerR regulator